MKNGRSSRRNPLFVERQDEIAALGGDEEVRVLDALGDALARQHLADVVQRDKGSELVIGNIGIYSHRSFAASFICSRHRRQAAGLFARRGSHTVRAGGATAAEHGDTSKGRGRGESMDGPIPAQKEPYGVNVEAGKRYFWCACGRSASQPFCDGSHQGHRIDPDPVYRRGDRGGVALRLQGDRRQAVLRRYAQHPVSRLRRCPGGSASRHSRSVGLRLVLVILVETGRGLPERGRIAAALQHGRLRLAPRSAARTMSRSTGS